MVMVVAQSMVPYLACTYTYTYKVHVTTYYHTKLLAIRDTYNHTTVSYLIHKYAPTYIHTSTSIEYRILKLKHK